MSGQDVKSVVAQIQAALDAGPTDGPWHSPGMGEIHAADHRSIADVLFPQDDDQKEQYVGNQKHADFISACNPANMRKLLAFIQSQEAEIARLRDSLQEVRRVLAQANEIPNGPIVDTIWRGPAETLFDYIDATITQQPTKETK